MGCATVYVSLSTFPTHILTFRAVSSFKIIATVLALYVNWETITPRLAPGLPNPFTPLIFISHRIESSPPDDPRYTKGYLDLVFVVSYVVVFSFTRQVFVLHIFQSLARWYGIKKSKFDRFGEQGYAIVYWGSMALSYWTCRAMLMTAAHYGTTPDLLVQH
jgi:acyl-CoA-dependent ceramide synthase